MLADISAQFFFEGIRRGCPPTVFIIKEIKKENKKNYTKLSSHNCNWELIDFLALSLTQANSCLKMILTACRE